MSDKGAEEWFFQSEYDIDTAKHMLKSGRYVYTVFMCHLAIEKMLKGLLIQKLKKSPPKTHNLLLLIERINLELEQEDQAFVYNLNETSVPTRYPEDLRKLF